jgi:hypothetical protein
MPESVRRGAFYFSYDGKSIGEFQGDAIRQIWGIFNAAGATVWQALTGAFYADGDDVKNAAQYVSGDTSKSAFKFSAARVVPIANENRPVSMSVFCGVLY